MIAALILAAALSSSCLDRWIEVQEKRERCEYRLTRVGVFKPTEVRVRCARNYPLKKCEGKELGL